MIETGILPKLPSTLEKAVAKARASGEPVLVAVADRCQAFDPLDLFERAPIWQRFLWDRPGDGFALVGIDDEREFLVDGPDRFSDAKRAWQTLVAGSVCEAPDLPVALPLMFAGFTFSPDSSLGKLPGGRLVLPRLFFLRSDEQHWVGASVVVSSTTEPDACVRAVESEIASILIAGTSTVSPLAAPCFQGQDDFSGWERGVNGILAKIASGSVEKVVLARSITGQASHPIRPEPALRRLARRYPQATIFAVDTLDGCFLGASPERLVALATGGRISVDCLAGSIARSTDSATDLALGEELLADAKERGEHEIVVRAITEGLSLVATDIGYPATPSVRRTASVQHLFTPVRASARDGIHILDLVEGLHPTPAVGGYPREKALRILAENERFDRGWYAGPFGWVDGAGNGDFTVAIRSALVHGKYATLYAGSGIVAGSDPLREYDETRLKLETMAWALRSE
jgi:isochorismate synthase